MHRIKHPTFNTIKFWLQSLLLAHILYGPPILAMETTDNYKLPRPAISAEFPYTSQFSSVFDSSMHYVETGEGDPILFLHGNPTSSYLWRNILPFSAPYGRSIAVDLIGMGQSGKPDIDYTFDDHYTYLDEFIHHLELKNITLVVHDWGAALGFNYARHHPNNVKAIAFMEGALPPGLPASSLMALSEPQREFFSKLRDPVTGPELVIQQNFFIEQALPNAINRPLTEAEMTVYRAPYLDEASRLPILVWPNQIPIGGKPENTTRALTKIRRFMTNTSLPMLLLYASPGAIVREKQVAWYTKNIKNIETNFVGQGFHFIQEDQPKAIGQALADWLRRLAKDDNKTKHHHEYYHHSHHDD